MSALHDEIKGDRGEVAPATVGVPALEARDVDESGLDEGEGLEDPARLRRGLARDLAGGGRRDRGWCGGRLRRSRGGEIGGDNMLRACSTYENETPGPKACARVAAAAISAPLSASAAIESDCPRSRDGCSCPGERPRA